MKSAIENLEYGFPAFQFLQNQVSVRAEGNYFQYLL
jgi:hypothetical protein